MGEQMGTDAKPGDYIFRKADESDFLGIIQFFNRHDFGPKDLECLTWKYLKNPDGRARIYIAEDPAGAVVCTIVHLPRLFTSAKTGTFLMYHDIDMLVAAELRGQKVYSRLGNFVRSGRDYMMIGFPNEFSSRTIKKELDTVIPLEEWRFPVCPGRLIIKGSSGFIVALLDSLSNIYAVCWLGGRPRDIDMKPLVRFNKTFDFDPNLIHGMRSAEYMNWRFIDNPTCKCLAFEFLEGGESIGYCVFEVVDSSAKIFDFIVSRRKRACLRLFVERCRSKGISQLTLGGAGLRLGRFGFLRRGSGQTCVLSKVPNGPSVPEGEWFITFADKD